MNDDTECIIVKQMVALLFGGSVVAIAFALDLSIPGMISAIMLAVFMYLAWLDPFAAERFGPPRFVVGEVDGAAAFTVPPDRRSQVKSVAMAWLLAAMFLPHALWPLLNRHWKVPDAIGLSGFFVFLTVVAVMKTVRFRAGGPIVTLTPSGVQVRSLDGRWFAPWDSLAPARPRPARKMIHHLQVSKPGLRRDRPLSLRRRRLTLPVDELRSVHPWFVYDAIAHYVGHPERRPAIGEDSEHEWLRRALGAVESPAETAS